MLVNILTARFSSHHSGGINCVLKNRSYEALQLGDSTEAWRHCESTITSNTLVDLHAIYPNLRVQPYTSYIMVQAGKCVFVSKTGMYI